MGNGVDDPKIRLASTFGFFMINIHGFGEVRAWWIIQMEGFREREGEREKERGRKRISERGRKRGREREKE